MKITLELDEYQARHLLRFLLGNRPFKEFRRNLDEDATVAICIETLKQRLGLPSDVRSHQVWP